MFMLWFKFTSSSNFLNWFLFFKPVYIFQTGSYLSNWFIFFKLVHHQNNFGSSSKVFGNLWKFSEILGKCSGTLIWPSTVLENLRKSLESGRKSLENHQKRHHQYVHIIKRTLHVSSKIWIFCSSGKSNILTRSQCSLVRYRSCHSNIKFISSHQCVISSITVATLLSAMCDWNKVSLYVHVTVFHEHDLSPIYYTEHYMY